MHGEGHALALPSASGGNVGEESGEENGASIPARREQEWKKSNLASLPADVGCGIFACRVHWEKNRQFQPLLLAPGGVDDAGQATARKAFNDKPAGMKRIAKDEEGCRGWHYHDDDQHHSWSPLIIGGTPMVSLRIHPVVARNDQSCPPAPSSSLL